MTEPALYARMELRIKEFEKQLAKVQRSTDKGMANIERRTKSMTTQVSALGRNAFSGLVTGAAAALAPVLSVTAALNGAKAVLAEFDRIGKAAKAGGLDAEAYQAYAYAAELGGVETEQFAKALETLAVNSGQAAVGKGRMVTALKALNPELLKNVLAARDQEERLRLVADALDKETDASRKAAIAKAAFGEAGARMVEVLKGGSAALDDTARSARQLGLIVDRQLIASAETLNDEFSTATKIMDLQFKQALVNLAPILVGIAERAGRLAGDIRGLIDAMSDLENRSSQSLSGNATSNDRERLEIENQILELRQKQRETSGVTAQAEARLIGGQITALEDRLGKLTSKGSTIEQILQERRDSRPALPPIDPGAGIPDIENSGGGGRNARASAAIREAEAVRELIAELERELALVGASDEQKRAANILRQAGAAATEEERARLVALNEELYRAQEANRQAAEAAGFLQDSMYDAFADLIPKIQTGNDALDRFLNTLIEAVAQAALLGKGPFAGAFGGGGGLLGGRVIPGILHRGGVAGRDGYGHGRSVASSLFVNAPRYHSGGIAGLRPGEVPAILEKGETVIPRGARTSAQAVHVTVGVSADRNGNLMPFVQSVAQNEANRSTATLARQVPKMVDARSNARQTRGVRA